MVKEKKEKTSKQEENVEVIEKNYPSIVLGLDISTACIGISVLYDDGESEPTILKITHIEPKVDKKIKGIEALILRKEIFENEFLDKIREEFKITECVIEAPLVFATGNSNAQTVSQLLQFNALVSEAVYRKLGIVPYYFTSYDARMYAFPELLAIRKFNKKGEPYPLKHLTKAIKDNHLTLFGSYPFDCEKKTIMMDLVNEHYGDINWTYDKKGQLKKQNYDACDSLVCALAYVNKKQYGEMDPQVTLVSQDSYASSEEGEKAKTMLTYSVKPWGEKYSITKTLTVEE